MAQSLDEIFKESQTIAQEESRGSLEDVFKESQQIATTPEQPSQEGFQIPEATSPSSTGTQAPSPLTLWERFKYSFGNEAGRRAFLEQRFPDRKITRLSSGKLAIDGIPIDPEGFSLADLPGDIVDVADELVRLSFQIKGAALGGGPTLGAGAIPGGAIGRGVGQIAVEAIGRVFGMQQEEVGDLVKDIAMETAIGGTAEAFGLGLRALSRPTIKFLKNFAKKITRGTGKTEQFVLNFTGGMDKINIERVQLRGADKILTAENLSDDALLRVGERIRDAAKLARTRLGTKVESGKGIIRGLYKANIDITDLKDTFGAELQRVGILNKKFQPIKPAIGKLDEGQKELIKIFNLLKKTKKISPSKALLWREQLDRVVDFARAGKYVITDKENAIAQGLRSGLKNKLIAVSDDFAKANADFAKFAQIEDLLQGKLDVTRVENFLKGYYRGQHIFEQALNELDRQVGQGLSFIERLKDVVAARDFASSTFRGIRSGLLSGMLGALGFGVAGPPGAATTMGMGIMLSTPRFAGRAIQMRQLIARLIGKSGQNITRESLNNASRVIAPLLTQRLQKR